MAHEFETLADLVDALKAMPQPVPVIVVGAPDPDTPELITVQLVSATGVPSYGLLDRTIKRVQVSCYAQSRTAALQLEARARAAALAAGFRLIQQRPAPEGFGELTDYRR